MIPFHIILNMIAMSQKVPVDQISLQSKLSSRFLPALPGSSTSNRETHGTQKSLNQPNESRLKPSSARTEETRNTVMDPTIPVRPAIRPNSEPSFTSSNTSATSRVTEGLASEMAHSEVSANSNMATTANDRRLRTTGLLRNFRSLETRSLRAESSRGLQSNVWTTGQRNEQRPQLNSWTRKIRNFSRVLHWLPTDRLRRLLVPVKDFLFGRAWCLAAGVGLMMFMVCLGLRFDLSRLTVMGPDWYGCEHNS
jgi:hypothetical protein